MASIYLIRCQTTGLCYVGQTCQKMSRRMISHAFDARQGRQSKLHQSLNEFGWDNHIYGEVEQTDNPDEREVFWINKLNTLDGGLNSVPGGGVFPVANGENHPRWGKTHSRASRERISANHANVNGRLNGRSRKYIVKYPDGSEEIVDCLKEWCHNKQYNYHSVYGFIRKPRTKTLKFPFLSVHPL